MTKPGRDADDETGDRVAKAFLVVRRGGRWTDLLRLTPDKTALVGRASANQIVIRSHQASRQHAEIRWIDGGWWIRDLASRNGTVVNRGRIDNAVPLRQGDCIEIAGCAMTFFTDLKFALAASQSTTSSGDVGNSGASDDQLTMDGFSGAITQRTAASRYVVSDAFNIAHAETDPDDGHADQWQMLFRLAFRLSSVESIEEAAQITTDMIVATTEGSGGGVYLPVRTPSTMDTDRSITLESPTATTKLVAFIAAENRSYRAPAPSLVDAVMSSGDTVIARNFVDDSELQGAGLRRGQT